MNRKFWTDGLGSILVAVGIALFIRWALLEAYVIPTPSMLPTLLVNDHIFVDKISLGIRLPFSEKWLLHFSDPKKGEVIVFKNPVEKGDYYVKRVIGTAGDRVFYEKGRLYVNEKLVEQSIPESTREDFHWLRDADFPGREGGVSGYVHWEEDLDGHRHSVILKNGERDRISFGPYVVPPGHLFVMGDNRDNSVDSRLWDPQASRAGGEVIFHRASGASGPIKIPMGTVVRSRGEGWAVQKFRTVQDLELSGESLTALVRAVEAGLSGNLAAGSIVELETEIPGLAKQVEQPRPFSGGEDKRFVPRDYVVGRAFFVLLSCEKRLPILTFLCNTASMRWSRTFHMIR